MNLYFIKNTCNLAKNNHYLVKLNNNIKMCIEKLKSNLNKNFEYLVIIGEEIIIMENI